jgi:hypothetical protein
MIIDELIAVLGYDLKGQGNLDRFNAGMERAASLARAMSAAIVAAGAIASAAMFSLGKSVINVSSEFEGYQTSLETIEGSAEKAKSSMDWISQFAAKTPYELAGVTEAFIKLRAYGFDPMDGSLQTLGDTASAMNKPLMQAVEAFADAATGEFERLKEFGIKAKQKGEEVTFTWQKNGKEMTKVVKKNGKDITKFLMETFGNRFNGAMVRQSKTWKGMMSNLGDSWSLFQKRIGDAGFFEHVKRRLGGLLDTIGELDANGTLSRWAKRLSDALISGFDVLDGIVTRVARHLGTIGGLLDTAGQKIGDFLRWISDGKINLDNWQALVVFFGALLAVLNPAWTALAGIALAVDDFLTYLRGGESVIGDFVEKMKTLAPSLQDVDWGSIGKSIGQAIGEGIVAGVTLAAKAIPALFTEIDWGAVVSVWISALKAQIEIFLGIFRGIGEAIGKALVEGLKSVGSEIQDWFKSVLPEWASEFFDFRDTQKKGLIDKATEAGNRRAQMETLTKPANQNTPGLKNTLDQVRAAQQEADQKARFGRWGDTLENYRMNAQRSGAGATNTTVNAPISTIVNLTVKMEQAAVAAGKAVQDKVSSALSKVPSHPTRTTPSPTF